MNILIIVDKKNSAIDRLSQPIKTLNPHLNVEVLDFHPKRPSVDQLEKLHPLWENADIIHIAYWKSGDKIKEMYPELWLGKPKVLTHHNPYDIKGRDWNSEYDKVIVKNGEQHAMIPYARLIPHCVDLNLFEFKKDMTAEKTVNMVQARIEGKKGAREVAQACKELGYKFILVGRISKKDYFDQIIAANPETEFRENITDDELLKTYYESNVHVCNSVDGFESGTLPILESMATGCCVLTRNVGHVPDTFDGSNMVVMMNEQSDVEAIKKELQELIENPELMKKMREKAWQTVKNRPIERHAREYSRVYHDVLKKNMPLVSVIVPTFDRPDVLVKCLTGVVTQDYPHLELIVSNSGNMDVTPIIEEFRKNTKIPIKLINFPHHGEYTLAKARNLGVVEAEGEFVVFCDERIAMEPQAVSIFVDHQSYKVWLYGVKDDVEKGFVENFSFVNRRSLIDFGMFNERINVYGGMSQEIRDRFGVHGFLFQRLDNARAHSVAKSGSKFGKKKQIVQAKNILRKLYGTDE